MLLIGRVTMVLATAAALYFAGGRMNILDLLVLVGAIWGALVFPVIASFYWDKVSNRAFTLSVLSALILFVPVRFGWFPMEGLTGYAFDVRRDYRSRAQAVAFQYMLDRLQSLNLIAWVREPGAIHITASSEDVIQ